MERAISVEEKIRRAEERYERRKQGETRPVAKVTVNDKKDIKLLRKMIIQILVCVVIYLTVYAIYNNQYVFSEDFINKVNEILSYDTNFMQLYMDGKNVLQQFIKDNEEVAPEDSIGGSEESLIENETNNEQNNTEEAQEEQVTQENGEKTNEDSNNEINVQNLSQEEQDIINIKNTTTFIKPIEGIISSKFGQRESATGSVPKNHTGADIAANIGTKIISATDGEVVLDSEEGDYRETFKNSNRRSKYYLCTLQ